MGKISREKKAAYVIAASAFVLLVGYVIFTIVRGGDMLSGTSIAVWICLAVAMCTPAMVKDKKGKNGDNKQ